MSKKSEKRTKWLLLFPFFNRFLSFFLASLGLMLLFLGARYLVSVAIGLGGYGYWLIFMYCSMLFLVFALSLGFWQMQWWTKIIVFLYLFHAGFSYVFFSLQEGVWEITKNDLINFAFPLFLVLYVYSIRDSFKKRETVF
jgi:hypothetical protein